MRQNGKRGCLMRNLEDCQADTITSTEIGTLVGRQENQRLEFKERVTAISTYELAKDLASFGNAEGGFVVVGAVQDKNTERCIGFKSVQNAAGEMKKIRDVAAVHIEKPLSVVPVLGSAPSGESVVYTFVPKSDTLLAVTTNKKAEYWKRIGADKREMTHAEVEAAIRAGRNALEEGRKRERALAKDKTRWNEITDHDLLRELMGGRFSTAVGSERWFRMTATPLELKPDRVNTGDVNLRGFIQFPYGGGQRQDGWFLGMGSSERDVVLSPLGLESQRNANATSVPPSILLSRSGHFEFWLPLFPWICFRQAQADYEKQPRLWPRAVVELPLSFLLLVKQLHQRIGVTGSFIVGAEYRNLRGAILQPGSPFGMPFFDGPRAFSEPDYGPFEQQLEPEFDPDADALKFALHLYRSFGYDRNHIPYFPGEKFTPGIY
jgi:hypothetical protein